MGKQHERDDVVRSGRRAGQDAGRAEVVLDDAARAFYCRALRLLREAGLPYLLGGAYALRLYAGIVRQTKDLDLFVRRESVPQTLDILARAGYRTELTDPTWLAKAFHQGAFIDMIFASANGICEVDEEWFAHAIPSEILGEPVLLVPPEETLWSKAFIQERERYDGADINHLLRTQADHIDWNRLLRRFAGHWRVLYGHLILFGFVYPGQRDAVPAWVMRTLGERLADEVATPARDTRLCRGTLLSRVQYLPDVREWGYRDARLVEELLTPADVARENREAEGASTMPSVS